MWPCRTVVRYNHQEISPVKAPSYKANEMSQVPDHGGCARTRARTLARALQSNSLIYKQNSACQHLQSFVCVDLSLINWYPWWNTYNFASVQLWMVINKLMFCNVLVEICPGQNPASIWWNDVALVLIINARWRLSMHAWRRRKHHTPATSGTNFRDVSLVVMINGRWRLSTLIWLRQKRHTAATPGTGPGVFSHSRVRGAEISNFRVLRTLCVFLPAALLDLRIERLCFRLSSELVLDAWWVHIHMPHSIHVW